MRHLLRNVGRALADEGLLAGRAKAMLGLVEAVLVFVVDGRQAARGPQRLAGGGGGRGGRWGGRGGGGGTTGVRRRWKRTPVMMGSFEMFFAGVVPAVCEACQGGVSEIDWGLISDDW